MKALLLTLSILVGSSAFADLSPLIGDYQIMPNQCNFQGLGAITAANVSTANSADGLVYVLKIVGSQVGLIGFETIPSRLPNVVKKGGSDIQFFDIGVTLGQSNIAITNTIHDEYGDGHQVLEAVLSLILNGNELEFIANEGSGNQEVCKFARAH